MKNKKRANSPERKQPHPFEFENLTFNELYEIFIKKSNDGILVTDLVGKILATNEKFAAFLNYPLEKLFNKPAKSLLYLPKGEAQFDFSIHAFKSEQEPLALERYFVRKDGSKTLLRIHPYIIKDQNKRKPKLLFYVIRNLKIENELMQIFEKHFTESQEGFTILNEEGCFYVANPEFVKMMNLSITELSKKKVWEICPDLLNKEKFQEMITSTEPQKTILDLRERREKKHSVELSMQIIKIHGKKFVQCICRDISEQQEKNHKITQQQQLLKKQKHELEIFAANIAHDIKGKLQAIAIYNNLIKEKLEDDTKYPEKIDELIEEIDQFVNNSLLLAKEGEILGEFKTVNLTELLKELIKKISIINPEVQFKIKKLPEIYADKQKLLLVFENLLLNALTHSAATEITISGKGTKENIIIEIRDNGKGISEGTQAQIRNGWETGIIFSFGLMIVKKIVDAHKGTITFQSKEGEGTIFTITLPKNLTEKVKHS
ncbi:MAG: ATP-binding protein [Candidatus Heimdallarchaeota archaeon]